jgi:catechol 2,3-dioxygenase-like lactoylglutathione lyase family enzyme
MTTATQESETRTTTGPGLLGMSHLGLSVRDISAAQRFWTDVMGFEIVFEADNFSMLMERSARLAIGVTNQEGQAAGTFDEHHIGLDHLALAVADIPTLMRWEQWLSDKDVEHAPVTTSDAGHHLNLRGPDNFPIELFVLSEQGAADLGLTTDVASVAGGHAVR